MENKQITVSGMLQHLQDGMSRKEIAIHYGITQAECKVHFQHPLLKNKKTIKPTILTYTLIDDVTAKVAPTEVVAEEIKVEATETDSKVEEFIEEQSAPVEKVEETVLEAAKKATWG